ncbi:MAG: VCBS repeat-containing protein [Deltaproteobacteria bacterium]|nr:VCBS repeat-containing protein [Deltaproteobacteria bacterium]
MFVETYPDGYTYYYGCPQQVCAAPEELAKNSQWPLALILSPQKEAVRFDSILRDGRFYLNRVAYAGGRSEVHFELLANSSRQVVFSNGTLQRNAFLYGGARFTFDGKPLHHWCFAYLGPNADGRQSVRSGSTCRDFAQEDLQGELEEGSYSQQNLLLRVYRFGTSPELSEDTIRHPTLRLTYSKTPFSDERTHPLVESWGALSDVMKEGRILELADMNNDGTVDALVRDFRNQTKIFHNQGDGEFFEPAGLWRLAQSNGGKRGEINPGIDRPNYQFADIDGDGYPDLIAFREFGGVENFEVFWRKPNGAFEESQKRFSLPKGLHVLSFPSLAQFLDVDQDGRSDIVIIPQSFQFKKRPLQVCFNTTPYGSHDEPTFDCLDSFLPFESQDQRPFEGRKVVFADMTGDGLSDLVYIVSSRDYCFYQNRSRSHLKHGDLVFSSIPRHDVDRKKCGEGQFHSFDFEDFKTRRLEDNWFLDLTGDGIADTVRIDDAGSSVQIWQGLGDGSFQTGLSSLKLNEPVFLDHRHSASRLLDIDGDGQRDVVIWPRQQMREVKVIDFHRRDTGKQEPPHLLQRLEFENGLRYEVSYTSSREEIKRDRKHGLRDLGNLHFPKLLVKQIAQFELDAGGERKQPQVTRYLYHKGRYSPSERKFLGFERVATLSADAERPDRVLTKHEYFYGAQNPRLGSTLKELREYDWQTSPGSFVLDSTSGWFSAEVDGPLNSKKLLRQTRWNWEDVSRHGDKSFYKRLVSQHTFNFGSGSPQDSLQHNDVYQNFDACNLPRRILKTRGSHEGIKGHSLPERSLEVLIDYSQATESLSHLGICKLPNDVTTLGQNGAVLSHRTLTYDTVTGKVAEETDRIFDTEIDHDPIKILKQQKRVDAVHTYFEYDRFGNLTAHSDQDGLVELSTYEDGLFLVGTQNALGHKHTLQRDALGRVVSVLDPRGRQTTFRYDELSRLLEKISNSGEEEHFAYSHARNNLQQILHSQLRETIAESSVWNENLYVIDAFGEELAQIADHESSGVRVMALVETGFGQQIKTRYKPFHKEQSLSVSDLFKGDLKTLLTPDGATPERTDYDGLGRVHSIVQSGSQLEDVKLKRGLRQEFTYYPWGVHETKQFDEGENLVSVERSIIRDGDEVFGLIDEEGFSYSFKRDDRGNLRQIYLAGEAEARELRYDSRGLLISQTVAGIGGVGFSYDGRGKLSDKFRWDHNKSHLHHYEYHRDKLDRVVTTRLDGNLLETRAYDFSAADTSQTHGSLNVGLLTQVNVFDPNGFYDGVWGFSYDASGSVIEKTISFGKTSFNETYTYNRLGQLSSQSNVLGLVTELTRNRAGHLESLKASSDGKDYIVSLRYAPHGLMQTLQSPMRETVFHYDDVSLRLEKLVTKRKGPTEERLQDLSYTFSGLGTLLGIEDLSDFSPHRDRSSRFVYSKRQELLQASRYGRTLNYAYTPSGHLLSNDERRSPGSVENSFEWDQPGEHYNAFGNMVADSSKLKSLRFHAEHNLVEAEATDGTLFAFGYETQGQRRYREIRFSGQANRTETTFFPTEETEFHLQSKEGLSYINLGGRPIAKFDHKNKRFVEFVSDHLGSPELSLDQDGKILEAMSYFPYGTEPEDGPKTENRRFTGQDFEKQLGLYLFGQRYYSPALGTFISPDPVFLEQPELCLEDPISCNLYSYAKNQPLRYTDPSGTIPLDTIADIGFIALDLFDVFKDPSKDNFAALGLDVLGAALPYATGLGKAYKGGTHAVECLEHTKQAKNLSSESFKQAGRGKNNLKPDRSAGGHHSVFQRDNHGNIFKYETYEKVNHNNFNPIKRFDGGLPDGRAGRPHRSKTTGIETPTPHIQGKSIPGGVEKPSRSDFPNNQRFKDFLR